MDKLSEREPATRNPLVAAPALAVQFFLIEIRRGGSDRRWPAAYELSRLMADPKVRADKTLAPALVEAFQQSTGDPQVRRYLALAIGRLDPPLPPEAVADLSNALDDPDSQTRISVIWALGSSGDPAVVARLLPLYSAPAGDAGIRKMVVYALGALPGTAQIDTLRTALEDSAPDVRWNAAVALARHGNRDGVPVLRQMLDRAYVEQAVTRDVRQDDDQDPIADVMISGLRAAATLRDESLRPSVTTLSQHDRSLRVREAALEALKVMG